MLLVPIRAILVVNDKGASSPVLALMLSGTRLEHGDPWDDKSRPESGNAICELEGEGGFPPTATTIDVRWSQPRRPQ